MRFRPLPVAACSASASILAADGEVEVYQRPIYQRPVVKSIVVDDGPNQNSITIRFNQQVTLNPEAIVLTTSGANPVTVPFTLSRTTVDDDTVITLSFGATGGELPDGQYTLTVDKDKVRVGPICERGAATGGVD